MSRVEDLQMLLLALRSNARSIKTTIETAAVLSDRIAADMGFGSRDGSRLNRAGYQKLITEDVAWLEAQPPTLERTHIKQVLLWSVSALYGRLEPRCREDGYKDGKCVNLAEDGFCRLSDCTHSLVKPPTEKRRPQVGDWIPVACDDEGTEIFGAPAQAWEPRRVVSVRTGGFVVAAREDGRTVGYGLDEEGDTWRWPATQGAAVAGPAVPVVALACPACCFAHHDEGEWATRVHRTHLCLRCGYKWRVEPPVFGAPPPPTSEPPGEASPGPWRWEDWTNQGGMWHLRDAAGDSVLRIHPGHGLLPTATDRAIIAEAPAATAAKVALEVRIEEMHDDHAATIRSLQAATGAKAALETQLRDERAAHEATWASLDRRAKERDALAERLNTARELLAEVIEGVDAGRISITVGQENRIRAALAAPGRGEEAMEAACEAGRVCGVRCADGAFCALPRGHAPHSNHPQETT